MEPTREQAYQRRIAELEAEVAARKAEVTRLAELVAPRFTRRFRCRTRNSFFSLAWRHTAMVWIYSAICLMF